LATGWLLKTFMFLTFCGGAKTVSGSCFLGETKKVKFLVDCGIFLGEGLTERNYQPFLFNPKEIDYVFLTHAHLDHSGLIPRLISEGFRGKIFSTLPTQDFYPLMLFDAQGILEKKDGDSGRTILYSKKDVRESIKLFETFDYGKKNRLAGGITFRFRDAGHILGSAIIEIWVKEGGRQTSSVSPAPNLGAGSSEVKLVFSGDLGNPPVPLLKSTEFIDEADYVLIESTYGDTIHENLKKRKYFLEDAIEETVSRGGVLLIPAFALERTQELLYEICDLVRHKRIPEVPIYIDSSMAIEATKIYKKYPQYFNQEAGYLIREGKDIFNFPNLFFCKTKTQSKKINDVPPPKVIIAGSGMSQGGRILHHELRYLPDPQNTILFICYQVKGTLGREILDGAREVEIFNEKTRVLAKVRAIKGYSAHADQEALLRWLKKMKIKKPIKKVFAVQGEKEPAQVLVQKIQDHLAIEASVPSIGDKVEL